jgi:hypothetical protein
MEALRHWNMQIFIGSLKNWFDGSARARQIPGSFEKFIAGKARRLNLATVRIHLFTVSGRPT